MEIKIEITELELQTLESTIEEHEDTLGMMSEDEDIKQRKKEVKILKGLFKKIKNNLNSQK